jgi:SynChlorMet cassette radical SAM/SPASM protein ScmE
MAAVISTPRKLELEFTSRCNLRCRYCYFFSNPAVEYHDLPTAEWLTFFGELGRLGVMDLTLSGGEAIIRPDIRELIQGVVRNRMRFNLLSNGALWDDDLAAFVAGTRRCSHVQISLDGSHPETHDVFRGRGAWEGAVRGIRILQRHDIHVAVRVTIHRHNVDDLEDTARFLLEELGLPRFSTNSAGYLGSCLLHADEVMLDTAKRQQAMETLLRLAERYPGRISAAAGPLAEGRSWPKMERQRRENAPATQRGGRLTACGCTNSKLAVRSDGVIVPCNMLAHMALGRINRDNLQEIWLNHPLLLQMRQRVHIPLSQFELCQGCAYQPYCSGNCPGLAYTHTRQVDAPSPDACLRLFLQDGGRLPA